MNDDTISDLKQFIAASISQQTADLRDDLQRMDTKIDNLSSSVAEAMENSNDVTETQIKDHETRITKLEQKAA